MFDDIEFIAKDNRNFLWKYFGHYEYEKSCYKCDIGFYHIRILMPDSKYKNIIDGNYMYEYKDENYKYIDDYRNKTYLFFSFINEGDFRIYNFVGQYKFEDKEDNRNIYKKTDEPFQLIPFFYPSYDKYKTDKPEYVASLCYDYYRTDDVECMNDLTIGTKELNMSNYIMDNMRLIMMTTLKEHINQYKFFLDKLDVLEEKIYEKSFNYPIKKEHNLLPTHENIIHSIINESYEITKGFISIISEFMGDIIND